MSQKTLLISGPPGCGKTSWILSRLQSHRGPCGYLRLAGTPIERPQFQPPTETGLAGVDCRVIPLLEALHLSPDEHLHFGRDAALPRQDTLDFSSLQAWERHPLHPLRPRQ